MTLEQKACDKGLAARTSKKKFLRAETVTYWVIWNSMKINSNFLN